MPEVPCATGTPRLKYCFSGGKGEVGAAGSLPIHYRSLADWAVKNFSIDSRDIFLDHIPICIVGQARAAGSASYTAACRTDRCRMPIHVPRVFVERIVKQVTVRIVADRRGQGRIVLIVAVVACRTRPVQAASFRYISKPVIAKCLLPRRAAVCTEQPA